MKRVALLFLVLIYLSGCNQKEKDTIKIGAIAPFTGEVATYGDWFKKSVDIAVEEINSDGGVLGKRIKIIYEDEKADPTTGVNAINKLIHVDKVDLILGPLSSGVTLAVAPIAEKNKIVLLTPVSSNYKISQSGDYIFRIAPSDALQGVIVADWTFNELKYKTATILHVTNDYGDGLEKEFRKNFEKLGGKIFVSQGFKQDETNFRTQLLKIKSLNPDFIFVAAYPKEAGNIAKQKFEMGINTQIIGTDPYHDKQVLDIAGIAANGIMFTDVANTENEKFNEFSNKYMKRYHEKANIIAAESYDGFYVLIEALKKANSIESDKIRDALYSIRDFEGASGLIGFDKNGDVNTKTFFKYTINELKYIQIQ